MTGRSVQRRVRIQPVAHAAAIFQRRLSSNHDDASFTLRGVNVTGLPVAFLERRSKACRWTLSNNSSVLPGDS
ncbi:MAG: Outer membrane protein (porin) [uncultured Paraburkholderia sp.]|nr:MAG: Outer membrane protein (porin) [uncultured Paraburkholderia sp.]